MGRSYMKWLLEPQSKGKVKNVILNAKVTCVSLRGGSQEPESQTQF